MIVIYDLTIYYLRFTIWLQSYELFGKWKRKVEEKKEVTQKKPF